MSAANKNGDGIHGTHPLPVGVAYFYRGHYIYSCPACNPIEPIPFSTKKGISIIGTVVDRAPVYDPHAKGLLQEPAIAALDRALLHLAEDQREQEAKQKEDIAQALDQEEGKQHVDKSSVEKPTLAVIGESRSQPVSRVGSSTTLLQAFQSSSRAKSHTALVSFVDRLVAPPRDDPQVSTFLAPSMPSVIAYAPTTIDDAAIFTPHDRAQFLAYSAPGSRYVSNSNTPYTSRPVSPNPGLGIRGLLRPNASTSRLIHLLDEAGVRRDLNPLEEFSEDRYTQEQLDAIIKDLPHPSSRPQSRDHSLVVQEQADDIAYLRGFDLVDGVYASSRIQTPKPPTNSETNGHGSTLGCSNGVKPLSRGYRPVGAIYPKSPNRAPYLPGLGHTERPPQQPEAASTASFAVQEVSAQAPLPSPNYWDGDRPLNGGRPRKASFLLNESYNAAHPPRSLSHEPNFEPLEHSSIAITSAASHCATDGLSPPVSVRMRKCLMPFHDNTCDGVTTTNKHLTEQAREGKGFKDLYPTIVCADERVMIDWNTMMQEERAMSGVGEAY